VLTDPGDTTSKSKVLFVCNQNRLRSPTAERLYSQACHLEVRSAGVDRDATVPITADLLEWADVVFVMEKRQRNLIHKRFRELYGTKRIVCLYIPDHYDFMEPRLVELLAARLAPHIGRPPEDA
jgi:predicted protein tyrosine phosphatase